MKKKPSTKLEQEKANKKEAAESLEYLRNVDVPEFLGGGKAYVVDKIKEERTADQTQRDTIATVLQGEIGTTYKNKLAVYGLNKLHLIDFPKKWEYYCISTHKGRMNFLGKHLKTQDGMAVVLKSPKGEVYIRAVRVTYDPLIDMKCVDVLVVQAENTLDSVKGLLLSDNIDTEATLKKTEGGVYLPN